MTLARTRRYRIVVGVDLSEYSQIVIEHALDQAARHHAPDLHFLHVNERRKRTIRELDELLARAVFPALQVFNEYGASWRARLHVRRGKPHDQIAMLAADLVADLIVIGRFGLHGRGVPKRVLAAATCPTLVVGMPPLLDTTQCFACSATREETDGDRWFCDDHILKQRGVTSASVWTGGKPVAA
jgi:nucleotide-binding universal stress UspA family protein